MQIERNILNLTLNSIEMYIGLLKMYNCFGEAAVGVVYSQEIQSKIHLEGVGGGGGESERENRLK